MSMISYTTALTPWQVSVCGQHHGASSHRRSGN